MESGNAPEYGYEHLLGYVFGGGVILNQCMRCLEHLLFVGAYKDPIGFPVPIP